MAMSSRRRETENQKAPKRIFYTDKKTNYQISFPSVFPIGCFLPPSIPDESSQIINNIEPGPLL